MQTDNYMAKSLELHLFFGRIMKEHAFFLKAGFTPANTSFSDKAQVYNTEFEKILCEAIELSNGAVSPSVLRSGELVTEYTALAEKQTEHFTGIPINKDVTQQTLNLQGGRSFKCNRQQVRRLNQKALHLLDGFIAFKENILRNVLRCEMFTLNYPLLIEHILREAKLYRQYVMILEKEGRLGDRHMQEVETFWNQIMMEHALFIRGLLDPTEADLFSTANDFAKDYAALLESCRHAYNQTLHAASLEKTLAFRDFKATGTQGIQQCRVRSIILPLLADHVLREANHYLRLLQ